MPSLMRWLGTILAAAALALPFLATPTARADSQRRFFYGDEAALTGAAGTAIMRDAGSIWYNPAGLGGSQHERLQVSGTVYGLRIGRLDSVLQTVSDQGDVATPSTSITEFAVAPAALAFTHRWDDRVTFGIGVYQTASDLVDLRLSQRVARGDGGAWATGLEYHERRTRYHAGPAVGIQLHPRFRIGLTSLAVYDSLNATLRVGSGVEQASTEPAPLTLDSQYVHAQSAATLLKLGLQWQPSPSWHLGLTAQSPTLGLWRHDDSAVLDVLVVRDRADQTAEAQFAYRDDESSRVNIRRVDPANFAASVVARRGGNWLAAEASYTMPLHRENQRAVFNGSLGAFASLTRHLAAGIGLYTDIDSQRRAGRTLLRPRAGFGVTGGVQFSRDELVRDVTAIPDPNSPDQPQEPHARRWVTTVGIGWSIQAVSHVTLRFTDTEQAALIETGEGDATLQQWKLYLGSGYQF